MKRILLTPVLVALAAGAFATTAEAAATAVKPTAQASTTAKMPDQGLTTPDNVKWGPAPSVFQTGAQFAVIQGDPAAAGPYVVRLKLPDGYKIMPHWHPTAENVTVLSGVFHLGTGTTFDDTKCAEMPAGSFGIVGPRMNHFAWVTG